MKNLNLAYLILFVLFVSSCEKEDNFSRFHWNQTKCSDPWKSGENNLQEQTKEAVTIFLESEGITVLKVDFDNNSPLESTCESCACGTGQRIIVDVTEKDKNKMEGLKFYQ